MAINYYKNEKYGKKIVIYNKKINKTIDKN